jgi:hypothetical protein
VVVRRLQLRNAKKRKERAQVRCKRLLIRKHEKNKQGFIKTIDSVAIITREALELFTLISSGNKIKRSVSIRLNSQSTVNS